MSITVINDDCAVALAGLAADSFDSLITDPPAGIGFMGKAWDGDRGGRDAWIAWLAGIMREALRVLKPGAHGLVWALPRTSHWTATALENAGFEIRDIHHHLFGTGFPKSLDIGEGRGTALKPAAEHWILVRKPLAGTVAANVLEHGTGALNIDACRIGSEGRPVMVRTGTVVAASSMSGASTGATASGETTTLGRWPAHVSLDEEAAAMLDEQAGERRSGSKGGASRFFYVAKPSKRERGAGNNHPTVKSLALMGWLIRLITPPGGTVLDPFAGSGTTLLAARAGGWSAVGIEQHEPYAAIARGRLAEALL